MRRALAEASEEPHSHQVEKSLDQATHPVVRLAEPAGAVMNFDLPNTKSPGERQGRG